MIQKKFVLFLSLLISFPVYSQGTSPPLGTSYPLYGMPWSMETPPRPYVIGGMYPMYGDSNYTGYPHTGMPWFGQAPRWGGMLPINNTMQAAIAPMGPSMQKMYPTYGMPWAGMSMPPMYIIGGMYPMQGYIIQEYPKYGMPWY